MKQRRWIARRVDEFEPVSGCADVHHPHEAGRELIIPGGEPRRVCAMYELATGTNRIFGREAASKIASASTASFFDPRTKGSTECRLMSRTSRPAVSAEHERTPGFGKTV